MRKGHYKIVLICCIFMLQNLYAQIKISSNSYMMKYIPNEFINEAGMDFKETLEYAADEINLSVTILPQNLDNVMYKTWQIQVSRKDLDWDDRLELYIKRTGDGKSDFNNKPQNGTYYQKIESNSTFFFSGTGWIDTIPLQLKIKGLSVTLPAKSYATEIIFTLIE